MTLIAALIMGRQGISVTPGTIVSGLHPVAYAAAPTGSQVLVTLDDGGVRIFDTKTCSTVRALNKHPQAAYAAAWSTDGLFVATGDETARIWIENARTGEKVREYRTHIKGIEKLSFNIAGNLLMSTGKDDQIKIYDLSRSGANEIHHVDGKGANFYGAAFNPRLPYTFATAILAEGGGRTYDAQSGNVQDFLPGHDSQGAMDIAFNPKGTIVASAGKDATTILMDTKSYKRIGTLRGHQDWVMAVTFSPNGHLIATSSTDRTVKIWDAKTLEKIADLPGQCAVGSPLAFTADGKSLVTVTDQGFLEVNTITPAQPLVEASAAPVHPVAHKTHTGHK